VRYAKITIVLLLIFSFSQVSAQFLGQMSSARVLDMGKGVAGAYLALPEDAMAVVGSLRYGLANYMEGRLRLGYFDPDHGDGSLIFGADLKYQLWKYKENNNPFDMALGGGIEFTDFEGGNVLSFNGAVLGSVPFVLENASVIEPYGQFHIRLQRVSNDRSDDSESDLKAGVNLGLIFSIARFTDFTAEVQIDDEIAFFIGVDFLMF
jgi:hypothetical protein